MGSDVTIVGAGIVGLYLAQQLKKKGLSFEIFEEHAEIGTPPHCTGLFSKNIKDIIKIPEKIVLNKIKGAKLISPSGKSIELARDEDEASVVDRVNFDKWMAEGLDIKFNSKITDLKFDSKFIIGADGPQSTIAKLAGFPELEETYLGVQYEIPNENYSKDFVELHFGNETAPGFFAWIVPTDKNLKIGLATKEKSRDYLDHFIEKKFGKVEIVDKYGGFIPLQWRNPFVKDNIALVGDAAGQAKPTTGGGVYMGLNSANILANALNKKDLSIYEDEWYSKIMPELNFGLMIRRFLNRMSDEQLDKIWELLQKDEIRDLILKHGDMDKPSELVKGVMKNPKLLSYMPLLKYLW